MRPALFLVSVCLHFALSAQTTATVIEVDASGRVTISRDGETQRVRLYGVYFPPAYVGYHASAKAYLDSLIGKTVEVSFVGQNTNRVVMTYDDEPVNTAIVGRGLALWDRWRAPQAQNMRASEIEAAAKELGLWRMGDIYPAWQPPGARLWMDPLLATERRLKIGKIKIALGPKNPTSVTDMETLIADIVKLLDTWGRTQFKIKDPDTEEKDPAPLKFNVNETSKKNGIWSIASSEARWREYDAKDRLCDCNAAVILTVGRSLINKDGKDQPTVFYHISGYFIRRAGFGSDTDYPELKQIPGYNELVNKLEKLVNKHK